MRSTKVVAACIFNQLLAAGQFLALDGTSMRTDPSTSGRIYRKSVNNAVFIRNESLFVVSATATSAFQLKHTPRLLRNICPAGYQIRTIRYWKMLCCSTGNTIGAYTRYIINMRIRRAAASDMAHSAACNTASQSSPTRRPFAETPHQPLVPTTVWKEERCVQVFSAKLVCFLVALLACCI